VLFAGVTLPDTQPKDETLARLQVVIDEQRLAEPITVRKGAAEST